MVPHEAEWRQGLRRFDVGLRSFNGYEHNKLWRNNRRGGFTETGWAEGGDLISDCRAAAVADFDRDGRPDIAVRTLLDRASFLHNEGAGGRFLHLRLQGTKSNRMGIGARVTVEAGTDRFTREMVCGSGFLSQSEPALHFGLGVHEKADRLVVRWPSGLVEELRDVPADRFLTLKEGSGILASEGPRPPAAAPAAKEDPLRRLLREGRFRDLEGRPVSADLAPLTLLHVWSPACTSCSSEAATLQSLRAFEEPGRVGILAVAVASTPEQVRSFVEKQGITYRVLLADEATARALAAAPDASWLTPHRSYDGLVSVGGGAPAPLPWTALLDPVGVRRWYRGPVKYFQAKQDLLTASAGR